MKGLTKEEFLSKGYISIDKYNPIFSEFNLNIYHSFLEKEINIRIEGINSKSETDNISIAHKAVNNLLSSEIIITEKVKEEIYQDYRDTIENAVLGVVNYDGYENEIEANEAHFKISSPVDAFQRLEFGSIWTNLDRAKMDSFSIFCQSPWQKGTGSYETIEVILKEGKSISIEVW